MILFDIKIKRKFGLLHEPKRSAKYTIADLYLGGSGVPPTRYTDLKKYTGLPFDQGETGSCAAQAFCKGARVCLSRDGYDHVSEPSRLWTYRLSRETHGSGGTDEGTYMSSPFSVCREIGWCTETHYPWVEDQVNDPVSASMRMAAHDQKLSIEEYEIWLTGEWRIEQMRTALSCGYPLLFGVTVDWEFGACDSWAPLTLTGQALGGHAMVAIGYDADGIHVLNSWGLLWGEAGFCRIAWSAVDKFHGIRAIRTVRKATS